MASVEQLQHREDDSFNCMVTKQQLPQARSPRSVNEPFNEDHEMMEDIEEEGELVVGSGVFDEQKQSDYDDCDAVAISCDSSIPSSTSELDSSFSGTLNHCSSISSPTCSSNGIRPEDTVILLDYDDTLLASTWLAQRNLSLNSSDEAVALHREELRVLEACAAKLLTKSIELGDVHLVTNAEEGWIELTVQKFMPALKQLLPHVTILSARSTFEEYHPSCPRTWKVMAFRQQLSLSLAGRYTTAFVESGRKFNIISLGDSHHEREALQIVTESMPNTFAKSVKFVERPTWDILQRQLELVHGCFQYIANYAGDLDLMLSQIIAQEAVTGSCDEQ